MLAGQQPRLQDERAAGREGNMRDAHAPVMTRDARRSGSSRVPLVGVNVRCWLAHGSDERIMVLVVTFTRARQRSPGSSTTPASLAPSRQRTRKKGDKPAVQGTPRRGAAPIVGNSDMNNVGMNSMARVACFGGLVIMVMSMMVLRLGKSP